MGVVRVSMQVFSRTLGEAQAALAEVKKSTRGFVGHAPSLRLDSWATKAAQTSDAYLVQLARSAGLKLATFDTGIPDAVQI